MAGDRFIFFDNRVPTHDEIQMILENYLGGCGRLTEPKPNRWLIDLPGKTTSTFRGIEGSRPNLFTDPDHTARYIEVVFQKTEGLSPSLDVMTRFTDSFTSGLAERLAREISAFYRGRLEDG